MPYLSDISNELDVICRSLDDASNKLQFRHRREDIGIVKPWPGRDYALELG
jgi:hypothetical protein